MKVVVFGGSGFLGSHIADTLTARGYKVTVFDKNRSQYLQPEQEMFLGDILDAGEVKKALKDCHIVYNLAGIADIDECALRPPDVVKYNILGNTIILEAARQAKISRYVFASSVYVYSNSGSFYRSSKQACESFIEDYNSVYGLPYTILRYGSLYGERADKHNGIYKLIKEAIAEGKIRHFGDGEEMREYIHVKDAADLSVDILSDEYINSHMILTGSQTLKYRDLLDMIKEVMGGNLVIEYLDQRRSSHYKITPYSFSPRIGKKLVKNPFIDMGQGLLKCMADIYSEVHQEKSEELGLIVERNNR